MYITTMTVTVSQPHSLSYLLFNFLSKVFESLKILLSHRGVVYERAVSCDAVQCVSEENLAAKIVWGNSTPHKCRVVQHEHAFFPR